MDHNPFKTVNMEEGEDIYCQTALATAGISSSCQQCAHTLPAEITAATLRNATLRTLPSTKTVSLSGHRMLIRRKLNYKF